jgi:uncharacterized protein (DUF1015 family)
MAEISPFRALHYNAGQIPDLAKVVTQPYDKISAEMQARYYELSRYNLVRIIRGCATPADGPQNNVYTRAARDLQDWIGKGVLVSEPQAALYPYYQEYSVPGQPEIHKQRRGFIALCRLEDYSVRVVHRHEETLSGPKADRLELLKATRTHFGQIFMLYSDPAGTVESTLHAAASSAPWECLQDEYGALHSVWRVTDPQTIEQAVARMRDKKLIIADGHHRYETALAYRNYCREQGNPQDRAEHVMMTFIRMESEGLTILPTHRAVHSLPDFDWQKFAVDAGRFFDWEEVRVQGPSREWAGRVLETLWEAGRDRPTLGAFGGRGKVALLRLKKALDLEAALPDLPAGLRRLDVVLLHRLLLEEVLGIDRQAVREEKNLRYFREIGATLQQVEKGKAQVAFLLNPTPVEAVRDNALAGQALPQKSTDFYPKLLSGLTGYWLDNPLGM